MDKMVNVYFFGKKYSVPADLTIMTAMEYAGYTLKRGCGCRHGFCGACATIYRIKGKNELKTCLACQTQVEEGMYVASIPFFPTDKRTYDIEEIKPTQQVMMELYPEIYSCIGCNACTKACTQDLNVMQYIAYAQRGELEKCAEESFDCVGCGCCSVRCPAAFLIRWWAFSRDVSQENILHRKQSTSIREWRKFTTANMMNSLSRLCRSRLQRCRNFTIQGKLRNKEDNLYVYTRNA